MTLWTERERGAEPRNKQEGALVIGAGQSLFPEMGTRIQECARVDGRAFIEQSLRRGWRLPLGRGTCRGCVVSSCTSQASQPTRVLEECSASSSCTEVCTKIPFASTEATSLSCFSTHPRSPTSPLGWQKNPELIVPPFPDFVKG